MDTIKLTQSLVIDVRSEMEYEMGNVKGSINIPLHDLPERLEEIKKLNKPIAFCCASGGRSGVATSIAQSAGIDCFNAGPWHQVSNIHEKI